MSGRFRKYHALVQQYGWRRCLFRVLYDVKRKSGLLQRRFPAWQWSERPLAWWLQPGVPSKPSAYREYRASSPAKFFFPPGSPPRPPVEWLAGAKREAQALRAGRFRYFSRQDGELGFPTPDWFLNPFTGQRDSADYHWCSSAVFGAARGDIKYVWEPSRFAWAYALARAQAADPDAGWDEVFWQLMESWLAANPPQMGPNWNCGQETAIRAQACLFALLAFWNSPATTDARIAALVALLAFSAERIAGNISYARSQMSNHGVGEAAGLWTIGVMFPELKQAAEWRSLGQSVLEDEARRYNYADGSYVQHSTNYQRFTLHDFLWCLRLAELNDIAFSPLTSERLARSYEFLYQLQDADSGRVPNYGNNDGALILPLNDCNYLDYRPVIGGMHYYFKRERLYQDGPWDEDLLWLFGPDALQSSSRPPQRTSRDFQIGGYFTQRGRQSWAMARCHSYSNRPSQADMLHLDLWWQGVNVLRDSGSYSYNDPVEHWDQYFVSTQAHNTIAVGGVDQMQKGPRFQWHSLLASRYLGRAGDDRVSVWQGEHYGYRRLPSRAVHRRAVCCIDDTYWLIVDDVLGAGPESVTLHWQLVDCDYRVDGTQIDLSTKAGDCQIRLYALADHWTCDVHRGVDQDGIRAGWESRYYGECSPAPTVVARSQTTLPARFITVIALGACCTSVKADIRSSIQWQADAEGLPWIVRLNSPAPAKMPLSSIQQDEYKCELQS